MTIKQNGGVKTTRKLRRTNRQKSTNNLSVKSSGNHTHIDTNGVVLIWINTKIQPTIYKGLSYEDMIENIPIHNWIEYRNTHDKNYNIYFIYDSKMISATSEEIANYISPISKDVIFIDIRDDLLKWIYNQIKMNIRSFFSDTNQSILIPDGKTEDEYITEFISEYLKQNLIKNSLFEGDDNSFSGILSSLKVPEELYVKVQNIGFSEFIYDILFSEETPIYFRVDILRVMAQIYMWAHYKNKYILTIDVDIKPDNSKLIDYIFNKPRSRISAMPKFIRNILQHHGLTMFNDENGMTLINTKHIDYWYFHKIWFTILIIHPILTYLGFLKHPGYFKYGGGKIRDINLYTRLVCNTFSEIIYKNYKDFSYYYIRLMQLHDDNSFHFASNTYNWISYATDISPITSEIIDYFENIEKDKKLDPIKKITINKEYLEMPRSQFTSIETNPCFK